MKKSIFLILPAVMLLLASCMDSSGGSGGAGSVRVVLPGSSRAVSGGGNADLYKVSLLKGVAVVESQTSVPGGAVEFNEVDAGSYTVDVVATLGGSLSGLGSEDVDVAEGEAALCRVLMSRVYTAAAAAKHIEDNNGEEWRVVVAGGIDDAVLTEIAEALKTVTGPGAISLDLSRTTGLESIGDEKFKDCAFLSAIVLPKGIENIGKSAFESCALLESVTLPDGLATIGNGAFNYCTSLSSIVIPDSVTTIGSYAFYYCESLSSIEIPDSVTTIGGTTFSGCKSLSSIEIPDSVTTIGGSAFSGCTSLSSIEIPDSVTTIGSSAFSGCTSLSSIEIPDRVTTIGSSAFSGCTSLSSIEIPDRVTTIDYSAFLGCTSLSSIVIPDDVIEIRESAFQDCTKLKTVEYRGTKARWDDITICSNNNDALSKATIICSDGIISNN